MKKILLLFIISLIAVFVLNKIVFKETPEQQKQELLREVKQYKHPVKSISMESTDNSDLKFLDTVLKDNKVLMLGENIHYDGATMQAKSRLIKYLHENLGYHIVLYEAGQYDMWVMNEEMKNHQLKVPSDSIGGLGLFSFWWNNKETRPLINYYQKTKTSAHPIELGGFDIQLSGDVLYDRRSKLLKEFLSKNKIDTRVFKIFHRYIDQLNNFIYQGFVSRTLKENQKTEFLNEISQLEMMVSKLKKTPENIIFTRYLHDMRNNFNKAWKYKPGSMPSMQFRDSLMAKNLMYQIDSVYQDQKVIVWCANIHTFSAPYNKKYTPLGTYIKNKYGKASYMVDFSSYAKLNEVKSLFNKPGKLAIENTFHATKTRYFFIDLRSIPGNSPLKKEFVSTINQGTDQKKVWSRYFDGIFYIDTNTVLTPIKK
ncbi:erythromycin esterase family protein [Chryseobacterium sp. MEBOG06]|uniref:erythromycin esterase family protein n=1 Tax=Chryseobacterium sp. MEBOG06 TaxID=2879938 RepID=UPI001F4196DE|nr:erythromycin esterase family protein [Chryseobacterium sp. MEBOG06]UKB85084.1 erythromycin esterase family protein [Chryseobacterium sp. MEBOG06]